MRACLPRRLLSCAALEQAAAGLARHHACRLTDIIRPEILEAGRFHNLSLGGTMAKIDKLIVTNVQALRDKYGSRGLAAIRAAIDALIEADAIRGLTTKMLDLASASQMRALRARPVVDPEVRKANKDAIDAVYRAIMPDYLVVL